MFNIGWTEFIILVIGALFILGPDRLPAAAAWAGRTARQVREYATGARDQLRSELGPEFDQLRKPLEDLRGLRDFNPRTAVTRALFDDDDRSSPPSSSIKPSGYAAPIGNGAAVPDPLQPGERAPFDPDAT